MTKPTTHVLLVTDKSGSMWKLADDVRGGYNGYLEGLRKDKAIRYRITSALFSTTYTLLCTGAKPKNVPLLDEENYQPGGDTALRDAIGRTITDFEREVTLGENDRVMLVVQTDGLENASREYDTDTIQKMIAEREAGGKWATLFMGAGPTTWSQGSAMGFNSSVSFRATTQGVNNTYSSLSTASAAYARGATMDVAVVESGLKVESSQDNA